MTASALAYAPSPSSAATRADRRSTGAYLHASFKFERAVVANHAGTNASVAGYVKRVGGECPGVLAGGPIPGLLTKQVSFEQAKQVEQESALGGEVLSALISAWVTPNLAAFEKFAHVVGPLRWHEPRIARLVHAEIVEFELFLAPPPDVCADMRTWVASDYLTLPPAANSNALASTDNTSGPSLEASLKPLENSAQKAFIKRWRKPVAHRLKRQLEHVLNLAPALLKTLGLTMPRLAEAPAKDTNPGGHDRTRRHGGSTGSG